MLISYKLVSHTKKRAFCRLDTETMGFPPPLEVFSTSSSINKCQFFWSTNSSWDIERILCKSELAYSDKTRSHKKLFAAYKLNTCYPQFHRGSPLTRQVVKHSLSILSQTVHCYKNRYITQAYGKSDIFYQPNYMKRRTRFLLVSKHI